MSTRAFRSGPTEGQTFYPRVFGLNGAVTAEHYLAAQAGVEIMKAGGNAVDAAVAAGFVEGLVDPNMHTIGGECPMLICMAETGRVVSINGNTAAPARATPEAFRARGLGDVPDEGILAGGVPAAFGAFVTALQRFGRLPFATVIQPALGLARDGFAAHSGILFQEKFGLRDLAEKFRARWPGSAALYLPDGVVPVEGAPIRNRPLARMFESLAAIETRTGGSRADRIQAVLDGFYKGEIADEIGRFVAARDGFLTSDDMARFETRVEAPVSLDYGDVTVFKCGPWNQGPVLLQALAILEGFDLRAMGHNSADYLHALTEAIKLAFADREQFYGDPTQVDVPIAGLLSKDYAAKRRALIDAAHANGELRPGDPRKGEALLPVAERLGGAAWGPGTVHVDAVDRDGNFASFTPSGAWIRSCEVIPSLGFPLGNRLMTFYLGPAHHPNIVAPFKRPRTTISPSLAFRGGRPWMSFGSMGGDQQDQWQLQFLLNRVVFGHTVQQAIEAPKVSSEHFPGFFAPHDHFRNRLRMEPRIAAEVQAELARRGHDLEIASDWTEGYLLAIARDAATGMLEAGCDPRGTKGQVFPAAAMAW